MSAKICTGRYEGVLNKQHFRKKFKLANFVKDKNLSSHTRVEVFMGGHKIFTCSVTSARSSRKSSIECFHSPVDGVGESTLKNISPRIFALQIVEILWPPMKTSTRV